MPMSEEHKFRLSLVGNVSVVLSIIIGTFVTWTTIVQKYDSVTNEIVVLHSEIQKLDAQASRLDEIGQRVQAQSQRMLNIETRQITMESRLDVLTSMFDHFISSTRPVPTATPHH